MLCIITEHPVYEDIMGTKFPNRWGDYLELLLRKAKIERYIVLSSETDLKDLSYEVIITLGRTPTGLLLKLPKSFKMKDYVGKQVNNILPWYSLEHLFRTGKKVEEQTIELLRKFYATQILEKERA